MPVPLSILETLIQLYQKESGISKPADYLIITRISGDVWKAHTDSKFTRADSQGFKYDLFHAAQPGNPKTSTNPQDLNLLSPALVSQGYETYTFAYRDAKYKSIAASGATSPI